MIYILAERFEHADLVARSRNIPRTSYTYVHSAHQLMGIDMHRDKVIIYETAHYDGAMEYLYAHNIEAERLLQKDIIGG